MATPLQRLLQPLAELHGEPGAPPRRGALGWVLWENCAYLQPDERRAEAYAALEAATGLTADGILALPPGELLALARLGGMMPELRVEKLLRIAELVRERFDGDLEAALVLPLEKARAALKRFPGIAAPGADFILLATDTHAVPALESNGLRVLQRLGLASATGVYAKDHRTGLAALEPVAAEAQDALRALWRANRLLRTHGQVLCKSRAPHCGGCPLAGACPAAD